MSVRQIKFETVRDEYLTEANLGELLAIIFPDVEIIHNKKHSLGFRPDYWIPSANLIVEYDGPRHFVETDVVLDDIRKMKMMKESGIKCVRIPYFVQMHTRNLVHYFFEVSQVIFVNDFNNFPDGFINKKIILPGQFCPLGQTKFLNIIHDLLCGDKEYAGCNVLSSLVWLQHHRYKRNLIECFPNYSETVFRETLHEACHAMSHMQGDEVLKKVANYSFLDLVDEAKAFLLDALVPDRKKRCPTEEDEIDEEAQEELDIMNEAMGWYQDEDKVDEEGVWRHNIFDRINK